MSKNGLGFREGFRSNPVQALKKDISLVTNINAKITALIFLTLGKKKSEITGNKITKLPLQWARKCLSSKKSLIDRSQDLPL